MLPSLRPIAIKERVSLVFLEKGELDVLDGAFVLVDKKGVRVQIPVGSIACLMLEPGIRISHAAVVLAARVGCLLVWVGEAGVRLYAGGQPGGARADRLLYQAKLALNEEARLKVVRKMYEFRFKQPVPAQYSVEQLRGVEGHGSGRCMCRWHRNMVCSGPGASMIIRSGGAGICRTGASVLRPPVCTGSPKRRFLQQGMPRRLGLFIPGNLNRLCTILRICSSLRRLCLLRSGWLHRARTIRSVRCGLRAVTSSGRPVC